jgi:hypothetical protein
MKYEILDEEYINSTSKLFQFYFKYEHSKFLLFNEKNNHLLKSFVINRKSIKLEKDDEDDYLLIGLNFEEEIEEGERGIIHDLCQNIFQNKFFLLKKEAKCYLSSNINEVFTDNTLVLGVFIEDNFKEILSGDDAFALDNIKQLIIPNSSYYSYLYSL